jgi:hypothetical protein
MIALADDAKLFHVEAHRSQLFDRRFSGRMIGKTRNDCTDISHGSFLEMSRYGRGKAARKSNHYQFEIVGRG